jgi:hypothetical protein
MYLSLAFCFATVTKAESYDRPSWGVFDKVQQTKLIKKGKCLERVGLKVFCIFVLNLMFCVLIYFSV